MSAPFQVTVRNCRPFVEPTGLDHDDGIDGLSAERGIVLRRKGQHIGGIPVFAVAQMQKDKNQQMLNVSPPQPHANMQLSLVCAAAA